MIKIECDWVRASGQIFIFQSNIFTDLWLITSQQNFVILGHLEWIELSWGDWSSHFLIPALLHQLNFTRCCNQWFISLKCIWNLLHLLFLIFTSLTFIIFLISVISYTMLLPWFLFKTHIWSYDYWWLNVFHDSPLSIKYELLKMAFKITQSPTRVHSFLCHFIL